MPLNKRSSEPSDFNYRTHNARSTPESHNSPRSGQVVVKNLHSSMVPSGKRVIPLKTSKDSVELKK